MARTPGAVVPSSFSSKEELQKDLDRRSEAAGFTQFEFSVPEALSHHGVKGMHWGVHKQALGAVTGKDAESAVRGRAVKRSQTTEIRKQVTKAGGVRNVNDKDLQAMVERMNLESRYSTLANKHQDELHKGRKATLKILGEVGKIALPVLLTGLTVKAATGHPGVFRTKAFTPGAPVISQVRKALGR